MSANDQRRLLVVSFDRALFERVSAALGRHCQVSRCDPEEDQIEALMASTSYDAALVDLDDTNWDGHAKIEFIALLRSHDDQLSIVVTTYDVSLNTVIPAMRAGASDILDKDFATDELVAVVDAQLRRRPAKRGEESGRVYAFAGRRGGIGTTTVAAAAAVELASRLAPDQRALLLDLSYPPPVIPDLLAIRTNYFVVDAITDMTRLDKTLIEDAFTRLPQRPLYLLALAPDEAAAERIDVGDVLNLLSILRTYFAAIVADLDAFWSSSFAQRLFGGCDRTLLCCDQSIATMHASALFLDALREASGSEPRMSLVVTRHALDLEPSIEELRKALGAGMPVHTVPDERVRIDTLRNAGQLVLEHGTRTPFARAVRAIVEREMRPPGAAVEAAQAGLIDRVKPFRTLLGGRAERRQADKETG